MVRRCGPASNFGHRTPALPPSSRISHHISKRGRGDVVRNAGWTVGAIRRLAGIIGEIGISTNCNCSLRLGERNDQESEAVDTIGDSGRTPREFPADHQYSFRVIVNIDSNDNLPHVPGAAKFGNFGGMPMPLYHLVRVLSKIDFTPALLLPSLLCIRTPPETFHAGVPARAGTTRRSAIRQECVRSESDFAFGRPDQRRETALNHKRPRY